METKTVKHIDINIQKEEVLRWALERSSSFELENRLSPGIYDLMWEALPLIETKIVYADMDIIDKDDNLLCLEGNFKIESVSLYKVLRDSEMATIFACTVSDGIERRAEAYEKEGEIAKGYLMDVIGSVAVEQLAEKVSSMTEQRAMLNKMTTTFRFSPGYGDFDLENQKSIFDILHPDRIGIELNEKFFMYPRKSISGIIGWKVKYSGVSEENA
ncbi:hypothetical protein JXI42_14705 [bacterium]|nr:hypothetical protein [bacterium]